MPLRRAVSSEPASTASARYAKRLGRLARFEVLILNEFLMGPPTAAQRRGLLDVREDRYGARSTLTTSPFPVESWHAQTGDSTLAGALLDRLAPFGPASIRAASALQRVGPLKELWRVLARLVFQT